MGSSSVGMSGEAEGFLLPTTKEEWVSLSETALDSLVREREAVVWPQAEAILSESPWVHQNIHSDFPIEWAPQPHHLHTARTNLLNQKILRKRTALLNGRPVTAYIHTSATKSYAAKAAAKIRRIYRTYLAWSSDDALTGHVAERAVAGSIRELRGRVLWVPDFETGSVTEILGRPVPIGPLDGAAAWAIEPANPAAGFVHFAVEVKNIRSWIYPWDHEVWDLLGKLADFPEVIPILVGRRLHPFTFLMFRDIGALGVGLRQHLFSPDIPTAAFNRVTGALHFRDASRLPRPDSPLPSLTKFLTETAYKDSPDGPVILRSRVRWEMASHLVRPYVELRRQGLDPQVRMTMFRSFAADIAATGLQRPGGWGV